MSMDGLRRGAQGLNNKQGGKGGGVRSVFYTRWKPPQISAGAGMGKDRMSFDLRPFLAAPPSEESKVEAAEPVVLIAGQYEDVYATYPDGHPQAGQRVLPSPIVEGHRFRSHSFNVFVQPRNASERGFNSFREVTCSCGPDPHAPQPCVGCYQYDHGDKNARSKDQWAFNIAHLGWYHLLPLVKDGQVVMKKDNSGPVMIKQECLRQKMENQYLGRAIQSGRVPPQIAKKYKDCEGCKQSAQWAYGDHRILQLGFKHLKNLFEIDDLLGKKCVNCNTGILRVAFDCEQCNGEILDLGQVQWTNQQIDEFSKSPLQCTACGHVGCPKSIYECGFDDNYNQIQQACANPQKTTLFDCVLWLQREGESTESEVVVKRVQLISQYVTHDQRALADHIKEIVKEPFNLPEMYKPDSLDDQAETIRVQNPYAQQQQQYTTYPGQQQQQWGQPPGGAPPGMPMPPQGGGYGPPAPGPGPGQTAQPPYPGMPMPGRPNFKP